MKVITVPLKPFKCRLCDVRFNDKRNVPRHMLLKHSRVIRKLECFYCHKTYQNKANYESHYKKTHLKDFLMYIKPENVIVTGKWSEILLSCCLFDCRFKPDFNLSQVSRSKKEVRHARVKTNKAKPNASQPPITSYESNTQRTYTNPFNKKPFIISRLTSSTKQEHELMVYSIVHFQDCKCLLLSTK